MKPGIYNLSEKEYHADPCPEASLSNSIAKILLSDSPYHAKLVHPKLNPKFEEKHTPEWDKGSASHKMLLEGWGISQFCIIEKDNFKTERARERRSDAYKAGEIPLLKKQCEPLQDMATVAVRYINATRFAGMFDKGKAEQTTIWRETNGIWCRSRIDYLSDDYKLIIDYKTTKVSADPNQWSRKRIIEGGYDSQAAFNRAGVYKLTGILPEFVFLIQENEPPYQCSMVGLESSMDIIADDKYLKAVKIWGECMRSGKFPSYPKEVQYYIAPTWAVFQHQDEEDGK